MPVRCWSHAGAIRATTLVFVVALLAGVTPRPTYSESISNSDFHATWAREDQPVAAGDVSRTWLWGPEPFTGELSEDYGDAPGASRTVQYFDKARMEINDPSADRDRWYVTTGLLATELTTGAMQTADKTFEQRGPALIPVAGDADDLTAPTYASFDRVRHTGRVTTGSTIVAVIDRAGTISMDQHYARYNVLAEHHVHETGHAVASVFWEYLNGAGPVLVDGGITTGLVFEPLFYATGLPITGAYWSKVTVGGVQQDVLIQVFERRVLTYTPGNAPAWRVEMGNVGRHYYWWRYERDAMLPERGDGPIWQPDLSRLPGGSGASPTWNLTLNPVDQEIGVEHASPANASALDLYAHYWHGGTGLPADGYRVSVEVHLNGMSEAGVAIETNVDDGDLSPVVYFGIDQDGVRLVTREDFQTSATSHLLRPAGSLQSWNSADSAWNELAVTVQDGLAWLELNGQVVGQVEIGNRERPFAVAIVVGHRPSGDEPAVATFRHLTIHSLGSP